MDYLWSPWRYRYITATDSSSSPDHCIFCTAPASQNDEAMLIVHRAQHNYVILNRFPYTSGHLMVVPYQHIASVTDTPVATLQELIVLGQIAQRHLEQTYRPAGLNWGINQGECAGAGVAGHLHLHIVPRWTGDANFMTVTGETRVLPEELSTTYQRLSKAFRE